MATPPEPTDPASSRASSRPASPSRRATGSAVEDAVAEALAARGWRILARRVRVGRLELDLVAVDPGPPPALVVVEVRWRRSRAFGLPEETVDGRKIGRLRLAATTLAGSGRLPGEERLPALPLRLDVVAVEPGAGGRLRARHHRAIDGAGRGGTL
jgi:putative endonuclease